MLLGSVGMTVIIVESDISASVKNLLEKFMPAFFMKALNCYQCSGFWSGVLISLFFLLPIDETGNIMLLNLGKNFASGCASSLLSVFWASLMLLIESKTVISNGK